ncbi:hypothetical protein llap_11202 [Limosa lapponica baueri]|uniref:Uncharacterized protein n=1 Tax=Limosa lapponica baueri TaxID=1758121 RepID=A0A2I0TXJ8_LIMLA|nr:hypothetical protein llap_11202 [Limosa lapponica baueri]
MWKPSGALSSPKRWKPELLPCEASGELPPPLSSFPVPNFCSSGKMYFSGQAVATSLLYVARGSGILEKESGMGGWTGEETQKPKLQLSGDTISQRSKMKFNFELSQNKRLKGFSFTPPICITWVFFSLPVS